MSRGRIEGGKTKTRTQDHEAGPLPVAIRWLSPEGLSAVALGLQPVSIGRGRGSRVIVQDEYLSERHAEILHADGAFVLRDLGSKNGTFVNGARVRQGILRAGDVIRMGDAVGLVVARLPAVATLSQAGTTDYERRLAAFRAAWKISPSELATLSRVVLGTPNKLIAEEFGSSISTIEAHVSALLRSTRVGNRTALVAKFWSMPFAGGE
jgi:DNA-binding CsgD family transcriptional regulator